MKNQKNNEIKIEDKIERYNDITLNDAIKIISNDRLRWTGKLKSEYIIKKNGLVDLLETKTPFRI